MKNAEAVTIPV